MKSCEDFCKYGVIPITSFDGFRDLEVLDPREWFPTRFGNVANLRLLTTRCLEELCYPVDRYRRVLYLDFLWWHRLKALWLGIGVLILQGDFNWILPGITENLP
jgi:hypothetical protein